MALAAWAAKGGSSGEGPPCPPPWPTREPRVQEGHVPHLDLGHTLNWGGGWGQVLRVQLEGREEALGEGMAQRRKLEEEVRGGITVHGAWWGMIHGGSTQHDARCMVGFITIYTAGVHGSRHAPRLPCTTCHAPRLPAAGGAPGETGRGGRGRPRQHWGPHPSSPWGARHACTCVPVAHSPSGRLLPCVCRLAHAPMPP